jgi:hypothetical protein
MSKQSEMAITKLREFFPDGATRLADDLVNLNARHKCVEGWREDQLMKFIEALKINAEELERAYAAKRAPTVAWVTRNLLELDIWIDYCNLSDGHAKRFKEDSARDILGFFDALHALAVDQNAKGVSEIGKAQELIQDAIQKVFGVVDPHYLKIDLAAEEVGRKKQFACLNKMFSKFAHPTAWLVDTGDWLAKNEQSCDGLFTTAVLLGCGSLLKIHNQIAHLFSSAQEQLRMFSSREM